MNLVDEVYEPEELQFKIEVVDKIPILHIRGDDYVNLDIPILGLNKKPFTGPSIWGGENPIWSFDGGIIELNSDDRGPDGATITIELTDERRGIQLIELRRRYLGRLNELLEREALRQHRAELKAAKKQKGRNVAAFRQTMGNRRPQNAPPGALYYGPSNPVPEVFAVNSGPGSRILEFLSGKTKGSQSDQARRVKRMSHRVRPEPLPLTNVNNLPPLVPNRGGRRRTRRRV